MQSVHLMSRLAGKVNLHDMYHAHLPSQIHRTLDSFSVICRHASLSRSRALRRVLCPKLCHADRNRLSERIAGAANERAREALTAGRDWW